MINETVAAPADDESTHCLLRLYDGDTLTATHQQHHQQQPNTQEPSTATCALTALNAKTLHMTPHLSSSLGTIEAAEAAVQQQQKQQQQHHPSAKQPHHHHGQKHSSGLDLSELYRRHLDRIVDLGAACQPFGPLNNPLCLRRPVPIRHGPRESVRVRVHTDAAVFIPVDLRKTSLAELICAVVASQGGPAAVEALVPDVSDAALSLAAAVNDADDTDHQPQQQKPPSTRSAVGAELRLQQQQLQPQQQQEHPTLRLLRSTVPLASNTKVPERLTALPVHDLNLPLGALGVKDGEFLVLQRAADEVDSANGQRSWWFLVPRDPKQLPGKLHSSAK